MNLFGYEKMISLPELSKAQRNKTRFHQRVNGYSIITFVLSRTAHIYYKPTRDMTRAITAPSKDVNRRLPKCPE